MPGSEGFRNEKKWWNTTKAHYNIDRVTPVRIPLSSRASIGLPFQSEDHFVEPRVGLTIGLVSIDKTFGF